MAAIVLSEVSRSVVSRLKADPHDCAKLALMNRPSHGNVVTGPWMMDGSCRFCGCGNDATMLSWTMDATVTGRKRAEPQTMGRALCFVSWFYASMLP